MTNKHKAYLALMLVNVSFGFLGLFVRSSVEAGSDVFLTAFAAWLFAALLIHMYASFKKKPITFSFAKPVMYSLWLQGLFFGLTNVFFFSALTRTTIANAEFIHKTMPIWAAIVAYFVLRESFTARKLVATGFTILGLSLLFNFDFSSSTFTGDVHAFIASLFFAGMVVNARRLKNVPHLVSTFFQVAIGSLVALPFVVWSYPYVITDYQQLIIALVVISVLLTALAQVFLLYAFRHLEASKGSLFMIIQPVSASIVGWVLLGESLSAQSLIGIGLVLFGVVVVVLPKFNQPTTARKTKRI